MTSYEFDPDQVDAFVEGRLDPAGEATLADQVAQVLPCHWAAPNPIVAALDRLRQHLAGDAGLFRWLDRHPGRPRVVARIYPVIVVLDRFSDRPGVVTALRELRERTPTPPGLREHLVPSTDESTLASLSGRIELLLCDGEVDRAASATLAALAMLRQLAPRAAELDTDAQDLATQAEPATQRLADAVEDFRQVGGSPGQ